MSPRGYPQLSAREIIAALRRVYGYEIVRQRSSHIRLSTDQRGRHSITVPNHNPVQTGTLAGILRDVAEHFGVEDDEVLAHVR